MREDGIMTLIEFLLARIAEDEAMARTVADGGSGQWQSWNRSWDPEPVRDIATDGNRIASVPTTLDEFMCRHDPARVLAECEAKRRIVEYAIEVADYEGAVISLEFGSADLHAQPIAMAVKETMDDVLELLALPYADHPDYLPEWKP